jgi:hypothetical protein
MVKSKFSAVEATLGYAYQVRFALMQSLLHARRGEIFEVGIETLDDVTFSGRGGAPLELLQTKHHLGSDGLCKNVASNDVSFRRNLSLKEGVLHEDETI